MVLSEILKANSYPGRGIVIGMSPDKRCAVIAYFIMGRSENSRNRIFVPTDDGIKTEAFDPSKLTDPSLVIYSPIRKVSGAVVVTNGDQTDTISDYMAMGKTFEEALRTRTFEPDPPIFTPRISGIILPDGSYKLSILKSMGGDPDSALRFFYEYMQPVGGKGHFIHTYKCDGNPAPSFEGEPLIVDIPEKINDFTAQIWNSLYETNKVSLYVSYTDIKTGINEYKIFNKNV